MLDSIIELRLLCSCILTFGDMLTKTACPRVPITKLYAATNRLNEMNIIRKGTSGEILFSHLVEKLVVTKKLFNLIMNESRQN